METTASVISMTDVQGLLDALIAQLNWTGIAGILVPTVTAVIGMVFAWWAVRKIARIVMGAFKKGKVSL